MDRKIMAVALAFLAGLLFGLNTHAMQPERKKLEIT